MNELEHLKSMWCEKVKRSTKLIVPDVTYENMVGSLNNAHWAFKVPYAFREALDIKYEQRIKGKESHKIWTQGPILGFKEGDLLHSKNSTKAVQVQFANPMGWDKQNNEMFQGSVYYTEYKISDSKYTETQRKTSNQMLFLQLLIYDT